MKTRLSALAAAVSSLSMLTACGGGSGSGGDGSVPEYTPPYFADFSSSEGEWMGTVGTGGSARALAGVVTADTQYWLTYSTVANVAIPAGFYAGAATAGAGVFSSPDLREFNFEGGTAAKAGTADAVYPTNIDKKLGDTSGMSLNGNINASTPLNITMVENTYFGGAQGPLIMNLTGVFDPYATKVYDNNTVTTSDDETYTGVATVSGTVNIPGFATDITYTKMIFGMEATTGKGRFFKPDSSSSNCTSNTTSGCPGFSQALQGPMYNAINFSYIDLFGNQINNSTGTAFTVAPGTFTWTAVFSVPENGLIVAYQLPFTVTLSGNVSPLPPVTAQTFATTYNTNYDATPSLATIAGSYTGTPAYTGIGNTMHTNTSTFSITSDGAIVGSESASGCAYTGTIAVHTVSRKAIKNVYAVTNLNFTGGSCPYTSSGAFAGMATYENGKLTLTAKNASSDKGFMAIVIKP